MAISSSVVMKLLCMAVFAAAVVAPVAEALSCGQVSSSLAPCINYLKAGGSVPPACCSGIRSLNSAAKTPVDCQTACKCLKSASGSIKGLDLSLAEELPESAASVFRTRSAHQPTVTACSESSME